MKERPILFSGPMVRAILDGRKTQTRRVVKTRPENGSRVGPISQQAHIASPEALAHCPYGVPGDRLWVKETWKPHSLYAHLKPSEVPDSKVFYAADQGYAPSNTKWWPSLFMQRRFSRLTLEIADIRVERLQDICEADALAEGLTHKREDVGYPGADPVDVYRWDGGHDDGYVSAVAAYRALWEHINGSGSWAANPWVWVVEFRRVEAEALRGAA